MRPSSIPTAEPYTSPRRQQKHFKIKRTNILRALGASSFMNGSHFAILLTSAAGETEVYASDAFQGKLATWFPKATVQEASDKVLEFHRIKEAQERTGVSIQNSSCVFGPSGNIIPFVNEGDLASLNPKRGGGRGIVSEEGNDDNPDDDDEEEEDSEGGPIASTSGSWRIVGDSAGVQPLTISTNSHRSTIPPREPLEFLTIGTKSPQLSVNQTASRPLSSGSSQDTIAAVSQRSPLFSSPSQEPSPRVFANRASQDVSSTVAHMVPFTFTPTSLAVWYAEKLNLLHQKTSKLVCKLWIKEVEPKKQTHYPYQSGAKGAPPWWPDHVRHKEPDHLVKGERITLLLHMLRNTNIPISNFELATASAVSQIPTVKMTILRDIYKVAKEEQRKLRESKNGNFEWLTVLLSASAGYHGNSIPSQEDSPQPDIEASNKHKKHRSVTSLADMQLDETFQSGAASTNNAQASIIGLGLTRSQSVSGLHSPPIVRPLSRTLSVGVGGRIEKREKGPVAPCRSARRVRASLGTERDEDDRPPSANRSPLLHHQFEGSPLTASGGFMPLQPPLQAHPHLHAPTMSEAGPHVSFYQGTADSLSSSSFRHPSSPSNEASFASAAMIKSKSRVGPMSSIAEIASGLSRPEEAQDEEFWSGQPHRSEYTHSMVSNMSIDQSAGSPPTTLVSTPYFGSMSQHPNRLSTALAATQASPDKFGLPTPFAVEDQSSPSETRLRIQASSIGSVGNTTVLASEPYPTPTSSYPSFSPPSLVQSTLQPGQGSPNMYSRIEQQQQQQQHQPGRTATPFAVFSSPQHSHPHPNSSNFSEQSHDLESQAQRDQRLITQEKIKLRKEELARLQLELQTEQDLLHLQELQESQSHTRATVKSSNMDQEHFATWVGHRIYSRSGETNPYDELSQAQHRQTERPSPRSENFDYLSLSQVSGTAAGKGPSANSELESGYPVSLPGLLPTTTSSSASSSMNYFTPDPIDDHRMEVFAEDQQRPVYVNPRQSSNLFDSSEGRSSHRMFAQQHRSPVQNQEVSPSLSGTFRSHSTDEGTYTGESIYDNAMTNRNGKDGQFLSGMIGLGLKSSPGTRSVPTARSNTAGGSSLVNAGVGSVVGSVPYADDELVYNRSEPLSSSSYSLSSQHRTSARHYEVQEREREQHAQQLYMSQYPPMQRHSMGDQPSQGSSYLSHRPQHALTDHVNDHSLPLAYPSSHPQHHHQQQQEDRQQQQLQSVVTQAQLFEQRQQQQREQQQQYPPTHHHQHHR